jgi:cytochrome b561
LHWSIAVLIGVAFVIGLTVDDFPKDMTGAVINVHALLGLIVLLLSLVRLFWRLGHPAPDMPAPMAPLARNLAKITHAALYLLMVAVPIIGIPTLLWRGRGLDFGLFQIASPFARTPEIFRPLTEAHEIASFALIGLVVSHVLAALYHQYIRHDAILARMSPWRG